LKYFTQTIEAIQTVLSDKRYLLGFVFFSSAFFVLIFQIQVIATPGNSISYQADLLGYKDWLFFAAISVLNGLFVAMEVYMTKFRNKTRAGSLAGTAISGAGTLSGIVATIFAAATCSLCVSAIFSFLGANGVIFLVENRGLVVSLSLILLISALVMTSRRLYTACETCRI